MNMEKCTPLQNPSPPPPEVEFISFDDASITHQEMEHLWMEKEVGSSLYQGGVSCIPLTVSSKFPLWY